MSERMIELQRAKLGLPPMGQPGSTAPTVAASRTATSAVPQHRSMDPLVRQTSQQAAATTLQTEDTQLKVFLQRLQSRDDSNPNATSGPTVPSALSRRMLQRQGVGYMDDNVAAITSVAADRFLATVLQQAIVCRDRRLKGAELMREEGRQRRKHIMECKEDVEERKKRQLAKEEGRTKSNLATIAAAKERNTGSKIAIATVDVEVPETDANKAKKSKKKKPETENGGKTNDDDEESSDDSLDDEEEYYQNYYNGEDDAGCDDDDEEELDPTLMLRDLVRPLEAWGITLTGKLGLGLVPIEKEEKNRLEEEEMADDGEQKENGTHSAENGQAIDTPPSPTAIKTPHGSPNAKGDSKTPPASAQKSGAASRAATPAPVASPNPKQAPT